MRALYASLAASILALTACVQRQPIIIYAPAPPVAQEPKPPADTPAAMPPLDDSTWTLKCEGYKCEIDYFKLHRGGKASYYYHNGSVYHDGVWHVENGLLVIRLNNGYATYRAKRVGSGFAQGNFENVADLHFTFHLSPFKGVARNDPPAPQDDD